MPRQTAGRGARSRREEAEVDARRAPEGRGRGWWPSTARAQDGLASIPANPPVRFASGASELLFDLGGLLQALDIVLEFLLHDAVGQLNLKLVERLVVRFLELDDW